MANTDLAFGFIPFGPVLRTRPYDKDASAAATFIGDVMAQEADGHVAPAAAGSTEILGASADYSAASTENTSHGIYDHPDQEFTAQDDGDSTTPAETHRGNNADHIANSGNANTRKSGHEIDINTVVTSAAGFRLLGFVNRPDVSVGVNTLWRCTVAEHHLAKIAGV